MILTTLVALASPFALADGSFPAPELIPMASDALFAPPGFDSNDTAQIVVHGILPNTCYKAAAPEFTVDKDQKTITVTPQAYTYSGCWCAPVTSTFTRTLDLGILPVGDYRVLERDTLGKVRSETSLPVAPAVTSAADDFLYAPVATAVVRRTGADNELVMSGSFSADCMEIQDVKVMNRRPHIIEVLPMAAYKTGSTCKTAAQPFEVRAKLPAVEPGNTLVYIRSLNGQSISLVELL
jgi:hypothetical protein